MGETWFGHYRLDRLLGSGGSGRVWLAHDTATDRDVALKVLAADLAADPGFRRRFTREARLAAQLRGPHTVAIHAFGEHDGHLYLDMELVDGIDAAALLRREGRLAPGRATAVVAQAGAALAAAHRIGLVHRDVKPSNLMVTAEEFVYLIDFGTAMRDGQPAITATGNLVGTLGYVAPERFSGAADARSDQYSLACVLFELLTGRRPFGDGDSPQQVLAHLMTAPPAASMLNPAVPRELDAVIARGMAKEPRARFADVEEFVAAARAAAGGADIATADIAPATVAGSWYRHPAPPTLPETAPRAGSKRPGIAVAALAGLAALIGGVLLLDRPDPPGSTEVAPTSPPGTAVPTAAPIAQTPGPVVLDTCGPAQCTAVIQAPPPPIGDPDPGATVAEPGPVNPGPAVADLPEPDPGNGNPGNGNGNGNGRVKPEKPDKPAKPDK
ncbi:serine/threonine-protein kinase [Nocardia asteroides]|uniref:serine/threonine-protein kinase n=1 Tax=Nocardia asteroides TaxID=1824 RepID=UPI001E468FC1|nr:serine/threonine-protein kinase [Nocardia asteroides]UGT62058.1 serine/threonine protein kinase [Nocardia asteroides]